GDAGNRHRAGTGGADAWRQRLEDILACDTSIREMGFDLRDNSLQCPCDGRVRSCFSGVGRNYRPDRNDAALDTKPEQWWDTGLDRGCLCCGKLARAAGFDYARPENASGMAAVARISARSGSSTSRNTGE